MKQAYNIILATLFIGMVFCSCQTKQKTASTPPMLKVTGTVVWTESYCGGAPPTQEIIDKLKTPKPLVNYQLFIKKGTTNLLEAAIVAEVRTNAQGNFAIELPHDEYVLIMAAQKNDIIFTAPGKDIVVSNKTKLTEWWNRGMARINSSNQSISIKLHEHCNLPVGVPFLRYTGPAAP